MEKLKSKIVSVLRWSEKYTQTDMVYLASGGFWLGIGQLVSTGSAFITSIAFANLLPPETFGIYKYIISIVSLLTITTFSGIDSAVTQTVARGFEGTLMPGVKTKMRGGAIGSLLALVVAIYYYSQDNMILASAFAVAALFIPFSESFDLYNSLLFGKKLFDTQTLYNIAKKIVALASIITVLFLTKNLYLILFVYFLSIVLPNLFFLRLVLKKYKQNNKNDPDMLRFGKHLSFLQVIGLILGELDKILVFQYIGAIDLAIYSLAVAPNDQIKGIFKNINSLAMPQFSQKSPEEIKKTVWNKVKILALAIIFAVISYIILAPFLFKLFFPKYLASVIYSQVLSISLIPVVLAGFLYTTLEAQKSTKQIYHYNLYSNILNLAVLFPLIYFWGIWGAIFARIVTRFFTFCIAGLLIKK